MSINVRYEIVAGTNEVEVFYDDSDVPSLRQPNYPDQTPWADAADAEAWAKLYIASIVDETAPYAPNGPGQEGAPKPTPEQIAEWQAQREARMGGMGPVA